MKFEWGDKVWHPSYGNCIFFRDKKQYRMSWLFTKSGGNVYFGKDKAVKRGWKREKKVV